MDDYISRADAIEAVKCTTQYVIESLQVTSKLNNPCNSLLTDDSAECKEQKSKLDLISMRLSAVV